MLNDWLLGDNKTRRDRAFELGLKEHSVRARRAATRRVQLPGRSEADRAETTFDVNNKKSSPNARRTRWEQLVAQHKGQIDVELGKAFEADKYDVIDRKDGPTERSLCGAVEGIARGIPEWDWSPYYPGGTVQAKVTDAQMASRMELWAAMGRPCTGDFIAEDFLKQRPEYGWMRGLLRDLRSQPWTRFASGMKGQE
jgi:hypothetical protein